jgi:hypothetical protein
MKRDHQRYVPEVVWLPTYIGLTLLLMAGFHANFIEILAMLIVFHIFVELIYRITFREARHLLQTKLLTFLLQVIVWACIWWWYVKRVTPVD